MIYFCLRRSPFFLRSPTPTHGRYDHHDHQYHDGLGFSETVTDVVERQRHVHPHDRGQRDYRRRIKGTRAKNYHKCFWARIISKQINNDLLLYKYRSVSYQSRDKRTIFAHFMMTYIYALNLLYNYIYQQCSVWIRCNKLFFFVLLVLFCHT